MSERYVVDADDYNEAVEYASDYFIDKWGLKDSDRYERQRSIPWCKTHGSRRSSIHEGLCILAARNEDNRCEWGVVWEVIDE